MLSYVFAPCQPYKLLENGNDIQTKKKVFCWYGAQICSGIRLLVEEGKVKLKSTNEGEIEDLAPLFEAAARSEFWNVRSANFVNPPIVTVC